MEPAPDQGTWLSDLFGSAGRPDHYTWEYRFTRTWGKALRAVGIPWPIWRVLMWPVVVFVLLVHVLVTAPGRLLRRLARRT
jgi:hypothetical protein